MNVVVRGRNVEVPDHFRELVTDKLSPSQKLDPKIIELDVELYHERNPRQQSVSQRVEITCRTRGPVVRAEATAGDFYSALDLAVGKLEMRLRRSHERRSDKVKGGARAVTVAPPVVGAGSVAADSGGAQVPTQTAAEEPDVDYEERDDVVPGHVVRVKDHVAEAMGVEDALFQMELVGHDFYLFSDTETGLPSVVYRRKGYDYGLIRLSS